MSVHHCVRTMSVTRSHPILPYARWCVLAIVALFPMLARAQPTCGNPPTNVVAASSVCTTETVISWTNPVSSGLVFPKVWRNSDANFATATLIYNPGLGGATAFADGPLVTNTNFFYWVGADLVGCSGSAGVTQAPIVGPLQAGVFSLNNYPAPQVVAECDGMRITWQPAWDATGFRVARVSGNDPSSAEFFNVPVGSPTSFLDTTAHPGNEYLYGVFPNGACGDATGANVNGYVRAGPLANAAGQSSAAQVGGLVQLSVRNPLDTLQPITIPAPLWYQWTRNGVPIVNAGRFSGNGTDTLSIASVRLEDAGEYTLSVQRVCGGTLNVPVVLAVTQPCRADFNQSGAVSVQDVFDYLTAFFSGCP